MVKKTEIKTEKLEREFIIPLREKCRISPRYKKTPKAVKSIKEFIARNMKVYDRDLKKIKLDRFLNELLWMRGIKNPPNKVKVRAIKEGDIVKVEAVELSANIKFKKLREERRENKGKEIAEKKKEEKTPEEKPEEESKEKEQEKKENKAAVIESGKEMEKLAAKQAKHMVKGNAKQPKHQQRVALQK
jgi:large subunit ribosomal protein L31e